MAGESLDNIWPDFCRPLGDFKGESRMAYPSYGTPCAAQGCHHCTNPECPYADFVRHYRNYPRCD